MSGRALEIVESLRNAVSELSSAQVFEAFAELDALPVEEVRQALEPLTGPAPDPEALEESVRVVHGFPLAPTPLHCTARHRPIKAEQLALVGREQIVKAGKQWDGVELDASGRVSDPIFSEGLEMRSFADAKGRPVFDVVMHGSENPREVPHSGTIFTAGTANVVGSVAYGNVELRDRARRLGLAKALVESATMVPSPPMLMPTETPSSAAPTLRWMPETGEWSDSPELGDAQTVVLPGRYETDPRILASQIDTQVMPVIAPAVEARPRAPKRAVVTKKAAAAEVVVEEPVVVAAPKKKTASKKKTAAIEVEEVAPPKKKTATKKTAAKKTATKKVAAKKVAAKKTATKKVAAKKTATKKVAAKKTATKKPAAKKKAAAKKKTTTKKAAAKKKRA